MPPIGGTAWYCLWAALHSAAGSGGDMAPSIDGTIWPPYWAAQNGGGVAPAEWRVQRTPNGALSMPGQSAGPVSARQPPGGALSGGISPDIMRGGAGAGPPGGPGRRRDSGGGMQWLPIGGMPARRGDGPGGNGARRNGAADGRHDFVPPMAGRNGAAYRQHRQGGGWRGKAMRGLAGMPEDIPRSRAVDRLHGSRPAGRRMRTLQFSRLELIRAWTNRTGSTQRWPPGLSPATCVAAYGVSPNVPGTRADLNTPHTLHTAAAEFGGGSKAGVGVARPYRSLAGTLGLPFMPSGKRRTAAAGPIGDAFFWGGPGVRRRIRRRVSGGNGRLDWWVASLPATRGIECGTGEPSSVYMAERRAPGGGFEPPRLSHLAVFKTAAFPLCQPGAGGADCRRWTGLSGMRVQRAGVQRVSVIRRLRRQDGGGAGGRSGIPNGMPQGTPMNALAYRRPIGRRHSGAANRRRPGMGGRFLGTPMGVLGFPPYWAARYVVPPIGGTGYGACNCRPGMWCRLVRCRPVGRHGMWCRLLAARGMVPAIAGPVCGAAWYGAALLGGTVCGAALLGGTVLWRHGEWCLQLQARCTAG